jgi:hypothetical protein
VFLVHGTKKFLNRVSGQGAGTEQSTTALGDWYATVAFWRPQAALFVNERTLTPVIVPLAPAGTVIQRLPVHAALVFKALGLPQSFIERETSEMFECRLEKTQSRSVVGSMNEFVYLGRAFGGDNAKYDPVELSLRLADVPCGPLYRSHVSPDRELRAFVAADEK